MKWLFALVTGLTSLLAASASAQLLGAPDYREQVLGAIAAVDSVVVDEQWHFTMTIQRDGETSLVVHDPTQPPGSQRALLLVKGNTPSGEELEQFQEEEERRLADEAKRGGRATLARMVDAETLALQGFDEGMAVFSFTPRLEELDDSGEKLVGELQVDTASGTLHSWRVSNVEPLTPAFSVTMDHYLLELHYTRAGDALVPGQMVTEVRGSAGFFKAFDTRVAISFGNYRPRVEIDADGAPATGAGGDH
jgi:hypothetical protein